MSNVFLKEVFNSWYKRILFSGNDEKYDVLDRSFILFNHTHREWYSSIKKITKFNLSDEYVIQYKFVIPFDISKTVHSKIDEGFLNYIIEVTNILFASRVSEASENASNTFELVLKKCLPSQLYIKLKRNNYEVIYSFRRGGYETRFTRNDNFLKIANIA